MKRRKAPVRRRESPSSHALRRAYRQLVLALQTLRQVENPDPWIRMLVGEHDRHTEWRDRVWLRRWRRRHG